MRDAAIADIRVRPKPDPTPAAGVPCRLRSMPPAHTSFRSRLGARLEWLLLPAQCLLCGFPAAPGIDLCRACRDDLPEPGECCEGCALPLPAGAGERCGACLRRPRRFASARTRFPYAEPADQLVQALKFSRRPAAARIMASLMAEAPPSTLGQDSVLVPVPLHWRRRWERGFDQAILLSRHLGRLTGTRVGERLLRRRRATAAQSGLDRRQRARNLARAFRWSGPSVPRHLILVDDVLTSGATLEAATTICLAAGVEQVDVWVFARTPPGRHDPRPDRGPGHADRGIRG